MFWLIWLLALLPNTFEMHNSSSKMFRLVLHFIKYKWSYSLLRLWTDIFSVQGSERNCVRLLLYVPYKKEKERKKKKERRKNTPPMNLKASLFGRRISSVHVPFIEKEFYRCGLQTNIQLNVIYLWEWAELQREILTASGWWLKEGAGLGDGSVSRLAQLSSREERRPFTPAG